jgi:hypothetical protein
MFNNKKNRTDILKKKALTLESKKGLKLMHHFWKINGILKPEY